MFYAVEHIPDESTMQAVVAELLPLVPFARREYALRYRHLHGQYCCLRSWQLLHELLITHAFLPASFPLAELTYTVDSFGKPSLNLPLSTRQLLISHTFERLFLSTFNIQLSTIEFSLSHTKNALAVAIDHRPIGIDVESVASSRRLDQAFLDRTMSADEQSLIRAAADPRLAFTELWTKKEALVKARGTGLNMDTLPHLLNDTQPYTLFTTHTIDSVGSFALTIAYQS